MSLVFFMFVLWVQVVSAGVSREFVRYVCMLGVACCLIGDRSRVYSEQRWALQEKKIKRTPDNEAWFWKRKPVQTVFFTLFSERRWEPDVEWNTSILLNQPAILRLIRTSCLSGFRPAGGGVRLYTEWGRVALTAITAPSNSGTGWRDVME